jgi:hypothetical protein
MSKSVSTLDQFETRRRKEYLAFLVVKFLKAHGLFAAIYRDYRIAVEAGRLAECALYKRVWDLVENLGFDMKEKAHHLFRSGDRQTKTKQEKGSEKDTRRVMVALKSSIEARSIDSYIATGYHLLLILGESFYQFETYSPEFNEEQQQITRIDQLARRIGYTFSPEETSELEHLRALSDISTKVSADTQDLILRLMERCNALFQGTAEVMRHFIEGASENEVLIQNLLQNTDLLEKVYGEGAAERIFWTLCGHKKLEGRTGLEKAAGFARLRCGNVTGIPS